MTSSMWRRVGLGVLVVGGVLAFLWYRGSRPGKSEAALLTFEVVARRTLASTIEATGTVEPMNLVEVKSKASGQIVSMPVEVGSHVKAGQLLAQIDPVDVRNQFRQASAALEAAQVSARVATDQRARAEQLFRGGILTAPEHESALLTDASAQSALVRARTDLENARLRLEDATVRAPISGTVLAKPVSVGQVIASATSSVSGGTTLLQMADLRSIRVRVLVPESDIGAVRDGMTATVTVDAYPNRPFEGRIEKVEPQAVVQQSVTMFPVLLSIANEEGLLLPGMNGEVVVTTARAVDALSVPADAVRSLRELNTIATAVGVPAESLRAGLGFGRRDSSDGSGVRGRTGSRDSSRVRDGSGAGRRAGRRDSLRAGGRRFGGGADGGVRGGSTSGGASAAGAASNGSRTRRNALFVIVKSASGLHARMVRLGVNNFDYVEVLSGVAEGDSVALLSTAQMQAERDQSLQRIRERVGTGLPGAASGGSRGGGATGGGTRGGGGR
ncbi:MAG TPA: efflux RND transporter periplasmic adaptor subunit [Candidatus Eisenbacteria bacterium]|nr:efflux RND transporter periplasmic adaptor subunit [Candidatus Eisenbacteria bacterium]